MLIRSQNKNQLINFSNYHGVAISYKSDCDFGVCAVYEMPTQEIAQVEMGNYSTEEKAIKVLDMISDNYMNLDSVYHGFSASAGCCSVFQMPQDAEV